MDSQSNQSVRLRLYNGIVKLLPIDANPILHGSVYFGIERESSDLDISLAPGFDLSKVEDILQPILHEANFKYVPVKNRRVILRMYFGDEGDGEWWVDFSAFRPTAYQSRHELLQSLNYRGMRRLFNDIRNETTLADIFSFTRMTNYRLIWLVYLWTVFEPTESNSPSKRKNFAKFLKASLEIRYVFTSCDSMIQAFPCRGLSLIVDGEDIIIPDYNTFTAVSSIINFLRGLPQCRKQRRRNVKNIIQPIQRENAIVDEMSIQTASKL